VLQWLSRDLKRWRAAHKNTILTLDISVKMFFSHSDGMQLLPISNHFTLLSRRLHLTESLESSVLNLSWTILQNNNGYDDDDHDDDNNNHSGVLPPTNCIHLGVVKGMELQHNRTTKRTVNKYQRTDLERQHWFGGQDRAEQDNSRPSCIMWKMQFKKASCT